MLQYKYNHSIRMKGFIWVERTTKKEDKSMKQFWRFLKQLGIGVAFLAAVAAVIFILYWIAIGIVWLTGRIDVAALVENAPWIILGMLILVVIEALGIFGYWLIKRVFGERKAAPKKVKEKKSKGNRWDDEEEA